MKLSVVVPAYNNISNVLSCVYSLRALAHDNSEIEYIIQDDASTQYSVEHIISSERVQASRNATNVGFPQNANIGCARANGDILFLVNQDAFAIPQWSTHWDKAILLGFENHLIGVIGARLLMLSGKIQSAGGGFDARGQPYHRFLGFPVEEHESTSQGCEVGWVTGAALATRRILWNDVGGFNAVYGQGYFEDTEYCLEVRERGFKVWYEPACTLMHAVGSTGGSRNLLRNAHLFRQRWKDKIQSDCSEVRANFW